jgi:hypothetical protein
MIALNYHFPPSTFPLFSPSWHSPWRRRSGSGYSWMVSNSNSPVTRTMGSFKLVLLWQNFWPSAFHKIPYKIQFVEGSSRKLYLSTRRECLKETKSLYTCRLRDKRRPDQTSGVPRNFFRGGGGGLRLEFFRGVQQIQLRTEGRENGDLGALAP